MNTNKTASDSIVIRGRTAKNRIVFLPCVTFSFRGDDGNYFGTRHIEHYRAAAAGGAGIVYVQGTSVLTRKGEGGQDIPDGQWTDGSLRTLETIASTIKSAGALAFIQLSWGGDTVTDLNALSTDDLLERQQKLLDCALTVGRLGFDGLEFHLGHSFLLCKLVDSSANQRVDRFGGSVANRVSVLTDIIPKIRAGNGDDFLLAVRMGAYLPTFEDGVETALALESSGIDFFNITFSMVQPPAAPDDFPYSDFAYSAYKLRERISVPVIGVGEIRTPEAANGIISGGFADMVGIARGILADPEFPNAILSGSSYRKCLGCPKCSWHTDHTKCPAK